MEKVLSISQVAKLCAVVPSTVQYWEKKGYLPSFKTVGGHRRFKKDDVLKFLEAQGRKINEDTSKELFGLTRKNRRVETRIDANTNAKVELTNGSPENKFVCQGKLSDVSIHGFAVNLFDIDLSGPTLKKIFEKYPNVQVWLNEEMGFLKNPLAGQVANYNVSDDQVRIGVKFLVS